MERGAFVKDELQEVVRECVCLRDVHLEHQIGVAHNDLGGLDSKRAQKVDVVKVSHRPQASKPIQPKPYGRCSKRVESKESDRDAHSFQVDPATAK